MRLKIYTIPNFITCLRPPLAVIGLVLLDPDDPSTYGWAILLFVCAELTDAFDGIVARQIGQVSKVGKFLDPLADSLARMIVFIGFTSFGWMPLWMLCIHIGRDFLVANVREVVLRADVVMQARQSGKQKAVAQGIGQYGFLLIHLLWWIWPPPYPEFDVLRDGLALFFLCLSTLVTAYSAADYFVHGMLDYSFSKPGITLHRGEIAV